MSNFILTSENYYSQEANMAYVSVSQYKDFVGTLGKKGCEEAALAKLRGDFEQEKTISLMVGSYVDAHFEGTLDVFKAQNPDIFCSRGANIGQLKSEYKKADEIISRCERDETFMKYMAGDKQVIMTGEIDGVPVKCKLDSFDGNRITDLKCMESLTKVFYAADLGERMEFVRYWGYDIQAAVYREIVRQNTGITFPFYIAGASKEKHTNIEVIEVPTTWMDEKLAEVKMNIHNIQLLKDGEIEPTRCETCDYCKDTKVLEGPISADSLIVEI